MQKYIEIMKITMKEQIEYRFNFLTGIILPIFKIIMAYFLWKAVFAEKEIIEGFSFNMMLTYYILTSFFMRLNQSDSIMWQFAEEVKNGKFTKYVVRPINPIGYFMSRSLTKTLFMAVVNLLALAFWIGMFKNYFVFPSSIKNLIWVFFFVFSGLLIMIQTNYLISMLSFKLVEIAGFYYMISSVIDFFSGALLPLSLLPVGLIAVIKYLPYYYVLYFPASIYLGINLSEIGQGVLIITAWNVILLGLNLIMYKKLFRYYEGVGA